MSAIDPSLRLAAMLFLQPRKKCKDLKHQLVGNQLQDTLRFVVDRSDQHDIGNHLAHMSRSRSMLIDLPTCAIACYSNDHVHMCNQSLLDIKYTRL
jgi:hypothetical protein